MLCDLKRFRSVSWILITLLLWHYGGGLTYAQNRVRSKISQGTPAAARGALQPAAHEEIQFDALLSELKEALQDPTDMRRVRDLKERLVQENDKVQAYFSDLEASIKQKGLSGEILNRHLEFVQEYEAKYATLMTNLEGIESAQEAPAGFWARSVHRLRQAVTGSVDRDEVVARTLSFLEENTPPPRESHFDPQNLPHRSLSVDKPIPPKLTQEEWLKAFAKESSAAAAEAPTVLFATAPPTPADLAETIEVQFTPEIRQLAESLGNNPVNIYNWVRNNIEFVPIWGSIQGAQLCMETRSCNAFDTASLLIALLRVSGIPARYQTGTIEVPIEKAMNWAGGFTDPSAAASLLASGGVPSASIVRAGSMVESIRLEHVWVKAFVDYIPSGGAVNLQGDTWIDMDPSFKQYTISSPPQDLTSALPFNRDTYLANSTTESPVEFYRQALANFVSQNFSGKTLEDFLIRKSIKTHEPPLLGGALPYKLLVRGTSFSSIPDNLRQQVTFEVGPSSGLTTHLSFTAFVVELLGKRISLSFVPASASDVQAATGFQGMYFTPPYLLSVKPILRLDGTEVASGSSTGMGKPLNMTLKFRLADGSQRTVQNDITAGVYSAILLVPHILTDKLGDSIGNEFQRADSRFGTLNIDNSDRDPWVAGGLWVLGAYYFNRLDRAIGSLRELFPIAQFKTVFEAIVSSDVEVPSLFGVPRTLQVKSLSIDADLLEDIAIAKDGKPGPVTAYEKLRGLESSFWEHAMFEVAGIDKDSPGVSTVRALQAATKSGVQIFKVNGDNLSSIEPLLQVSAEVKEAVRNGVNAGLEVTIPAANVQLGKWRGVGYIVEDPLTGAGAYQISGMLSGAVIDMPYPGQTGGSPPPVIASNPNAIVVVGFVPSTGLKAAYESLIGLNPHRAADTIGHILFNAGYNVFVRQVYADTIRDKVNTSGNPTPNDVLTIIAHGSDGEFTMPATTGILAPVTPQGFSRQFKIVLLSACATGGVCKDRDDWLKFLIPPTCTPDEKLQDRWASALLGSPQPTPGKALVGYAIPVSGQAILHDAKNFWLGLVNGNDVGNMAAIIHDSYFRGDRRATLPVNP